MRILAVIVDGHGLVHVGAQRSPYLRRRELAARTGEAFLIDVGLAPPGLAAASILDRVDRLLADERIEPGVYVATSEDVRTAMRRATAAARRALLAAALRRRAARIVRPSRCTWLGRAKAA